MAALPAGWVGPGVTVVPGRASGAGGTSGAADGSIARALTLPCTCVLPPDSISTVPPLGPFASITLVGANTTACLPRSVTVPFSPTTAELAWIVPLLRTRPPYIDTCLAIRVPMFTASSLLLEISTRIEGRSISEISTLRPAASRITPFGASIRPEFSTRGATRITWPPAAVRMLPSLRTAPAPGVSLKRRRPARKS